MVDCQPGNCVIGQKFSRQLRIIPIREDEKGKQFYASEFWYAAVRFSVKELKAMRERRIQYLCALVEVICMEKMFVYL